MKKCCVNCGVMFDTEYKNVKSICPKCDKRINHYDIDNDVVEVLENESDIDKDDIYDEM